MAKFKVLKGVAHNIGHSFTSLMNYSQDDYSMGHILRFARESGIGTLSIDLLKAQGTPPELLQEPISGLPSWYSKMFLQMVQSSGSDRELIQSATLTLTYDLQRTKPSSTENEPLSPYSCEVVILGVRGRSYTSYFSGWWFVEKMAVRRRYLPVLRKSSARQWWNPFSWFRWQ